MRRFLCLALFSILALPASAQKEDWLPITQEDLQIKQVPGNPDATAIRLYYANYLDDGNRFEFFYHRIKILNEAGKKYADVEISGGFSVDVSNLKARTVHPDGSIVEFTGKVFDKTILKGQGLKWIAKAFTLPEVTPGSIVEYKYRLKNYSSKLWVLQDDLYTVREVFSFQPRGYGERLSWAGRNLKDRVPVRKGDGWELEWKNVPEFQTEANMPPQANYKPTVNFYYVREDIKNEEKFWLETGKWLHDWMDHYIGNRKEVKEAALQAIGGETDPEKKLRRLYDRAQQIRNLSYERQRNAEERKRENIRENENMADIARRGYGDSDEITAFFVGMARAAGFDAQVVLVSNRSEAFFSPKLLTLSELPDWVALVNLNGKDVYLQPSVRFCPFGLMVWANTSTDALRFDSKGGHFVLVPSLTDERSVTRRAANMELTAEGSIRGEIAIEFTGEDALEHRLNAIDTDEVGRKKILEDELKAWLPVGAIVKLVTAQGWETSVDPLSARFSVEVPGYASMAGKRMLVPSLLFQPQQRDAFKHADRKYPLYFPHPFIQRDKVVFKLPGGYTLESLPVKQDVGIGYARYQSVSASDGKQLVSERAFAFNAIVVQLAKYPELKQFMARIQAGDEQQVILQMAAGIKTETAH